MNGPPAPAFRHRSAGSQDEPDGESAYWRDGWYYDPATGSLTAVAQADLPFGADLQDLLNRVSEALRDDADRSSLSATQQLSKSWLLRTFVKSDWPIELHAAVLPAPGGAEQAGSVYCVLSPNREKTLRSISFYDGESQMEKRGVSAFASRSRLLPAERKAARLAARAARPAGTRGTTPRRYPCFHPASMPVKTETVKRKRR